MRIAGNRPTPAGSAVDTFGFSQANRLTSATVAGSNETYTYDGDGTRFSRQVGTNPAIRYVSDGATGLPVTIDDGTRKYVYGAGLAYAVSGTVVEVYHTDGLGSVRALTNASGAVTATYRVDEWGRSTATTGTSSQPFGFTGEPRDATGLTYLRARYYDPDLGRFMSRDTWHGGPAAPQTRTGTPLRTTTPRRTPTRAVTSSIRSSTSGSSSSTLRRSSSGRRRSAARTWPPSVSMLAPRACRS